ncbi:glutathione S-transferase family protein [Pseudocolwellia agarivorans]|uniref:glutathione S-transferase family protein n=1 Tax=Pseudocolwellia agarivorans TaxID=1911682 RepID=UPI000984EEB7|nr:glutathione S-transferase family protein [Pseudocolwellia agarivorans]
MRLINLDHSPYAARVKIQILQKGLPIEMIAPPVKLKTPEFLKAFPLGKVPLLELDNGDYLPESLAIMQYLEELYPEPSCQPSSAIEKANMRVVMSYTDTHLGPALLPFFKAMLIPNFSFDQEQQVQLVIQTLEKMDRWLAINDSFEREINLGDMTLRPTIWYVQKILPQYTQEKPCETLQNLSLWLKMVDQNSHVVTTLNAMEVAFNQFMNPTK